MNVIDLTEEHMPVYFCCLEDWSEDIKEAGDHKSNWFEMYKNRGLGVKLAVDDDGRVAGMIQYLPIEESFIRGRGLYIILCIWVHGHKQGLGDRRKRGLGKALLAAAEADVKQRGAKGIAAWGLSIPIWMKASWFRKRGYRKVDKMGLQMLVWKPFTEDARAPEWTRPKKKPGRRPGKVTVTAFKHGWCPAQNIAFERAKRASEEWKDLVDFVAIDTTRSDAFEEWGHVDALFIDGSQVRTGPPPSYAKIRKKIARRIKTL